MTSFVPIRRLLAEEDGSMLVVAGIVAVVLVLLSAATLEFGKSAIHRRHLQMQTDAAALAAGQLFDLCVSSPSTARSAMEVQAQKYGGFDGSQTNELVGNTGTVSWNDNRLAYPAGSHLPDTDFTDNVDPCVGALFDVKATESNIPGLFSVTQPGTINAHARVQLYELNETKGLLPIAVPDVRFNYAFATFIDESTGSPISGCSSNCTIPLFSYGPNSSGQQVWMPSQGASLSVPISAANIGIRLRLVAGTDPNAPCGQLYTECYTDPSTTNQGLVYIRGWQASSTSPPPVQAHNAWLQPGDCTPDAYFTTSDCSAGLLAEIDFGDRSVTGSGVTATVSATIAGGGSVSLSRGSLVIGTTYQWSTSSGLAVSSPGAHAVTLTYDWSQTSGTWRGKNCTTKGSNPCHDNGSINGGNPVQRAFEGSVDGSGPLQTVQVYEAGVNTSGANSFQQGSTHSLGVAVLSEGTLQWTAAASAKPIVLRIVGGSQNQSIDCDPAQSNIRDEITKGCAPTYIKNPTLSCPYSNTPALWASPQPWSCVAVQTGSSVGQVEQGLQNRILGGSNTCTAPIHWPYVQSQYPNDPRVIPLIVTPFGAFSGQGSAVVPVVDFGAFYVAGWDEDPCPGAVTNLPKGDISGYFIKYIPPPGNNTGNTQCYLTDPNQITPCVAVLTR